MSSPALIEPPRWWPNRAYVTASKTEDLPDPLSPDSIHRLEPSNATSCSSVYDRNPLNLTRRGIMLAPPGTACVPMNAERGTRNAERDVTVHLARSAFRVPRSALPILRREQLFQPVHQLCSLLVRVRHQFVPDVLADRLLKPLAVGRPVARHQRRPEGCRLLPVADVVPREDCLRLPQHFLQAVGPGRV